MRIRDCSSDVCSSDLEDGSSPLSQAGAVIHGNFFGQSSFGTYAIAHRRNTVKVDKNLPLDILGPLGCCVMTGARSEEHTSELQSLMRLSYSVFFLKTNTFLFFFFFFISFFFISYFLYFLFLYFLFYFF